MDAEQTLLANAMLEAGLFDVEFYRSQIVDTPCSSDLELAIHYLKVGERQGLSPCGRFDPVYYRQYNPDLEKIDSPIAHFIENGQREGRSGSLASLLLLEKLDTALFEYQLVPPPAVNRDHLDYCTTLAASLKWIDKDPRYFSRDFYLKRYPELATLPRDPLFHYLKWGRHEGRVTNVSQMQKIHIDSDAIDPDLPFIMVGVHEATMTGAPIVGLDLARELVDEYNVIFVTLGDGPLLETARNIFPIVICASLSDEDNRFFIETISRKYWFDDAIFSSSACVSFIRPLASLDCRITCLVHEFLEYMLYTRSIIYVCDLLVFSSRELLKSWQYMLDDLDRDPASIMVLAQPSSSANARTMAKADARAVVAAEMGVDLEEATLVLGAGLVQIRKGTDIFLQVGNQLRREAGKFVTIWIGQQASEFDIAFGVWFHAQMERSRDESGSLSVHFEPAGPMYKVLMDAADVFLVTSRLDPLPNVALDAAARDVPVISFKGATGLADIAERGDITLVEVEMAAIDEVIKAIRSVTQSMQAPGRPKVVTRDRQALIGAD